MNSEARAAVRPTPAAAGACDRGLRDARVLQSVPGDAGSLPRLRRRVRARPGGFRGTAGSRIRTRPAGRNRAARRRGLSLHEPTARHRLPSGRRGCLVRCRAQGHARLGRRRRAGASRRLPRDRAGPVRRVAATGARRDAHRRPEPRHELCGQRHECTRPRHRGHRLRAPGDDRGSHRGLVGTALRRGRDPAAEALPARAARRRRLLHLRDLPDLERVSRRCSPASRPATP